MTQDLLSIYYVKFASIAHKLNVLNGIDVKKAFDMIYSSDLYLEIVFPSDPEDYQETYPSYWAYYRLCKENGIEPKPAMEVYGDYLWKEEQKCALAFELYRAIHNTEPGFLSYLFDKNGVYDMFLDNTMPRQDKKLQKEAYMLIETSCHKECIETNKTYRQLMNR